jgi:hypothetical protein
MFSPPFDRRQYLGFSARLSLGLGYAIAERDIRRGTSQISGLNGVITLDLGATPIENLVVFGRIGGVGFDHARAADSPNAGTAFFGVFGAGARYHFMPIDWYASGVLALTAVSVDNDVGIPQKAGPGFGFEIETGKNWWAGSYRESWTVGLGLRFAYLRSGSVTPRARERTEDPWQATALSLVFSTAYN